MRAAGALTLLPLILFLVWWSVWSVAFTVAVATVIGLLELYSAFAAGGYRPRTTLGIVIGLALVAAATFSRWSPSTCFR